MRKYIKIISISLLLFTFIYSQVDTEYDVKARLVLKISYNNHTFYDLLGEGNDYIYGGLSQQIKGTVYLSELDPELKEKLINKAPSNARKHISKLGSISVSASTFFSPYIFIPQDFSYQKEEELEFLYLNWPFFALGLGPIGIDASITSLYLDDNLNFDKGQLKFRPSVGLSLGLQDLSFSKKFPISVDINYNYRYLLPGIKFYDDFSFTSIGSQPSFTLNFKVPIDIPVKSSSL